jgi:hypothetical protein
MDDTVGESSTLNLRRALNMSKNSRQLLIFLALGVVSAIGLANAQEQSDVNRAQVLKVDSTDRILAEKYREVSPLAVLERLSVSKSVSATDKNTFWRVHVALYLVKRPNLNKSQRRIILDALFMASLAITTNDFSETAEKNEALHSLRQRARKAFRKNEVAEIFANIGDRKAEDDLLQKYKDISALPMKKRKDVFRKASAKDKSDLWKTHLALYLVKHPELNEWQKETVFGGHVFSNVSLV